MKLTELLLVGLVLWTLLGTGGTALWAIRGDRRRTRQGLLWIGAVWATYLLVLAAVSVRQQGEQMRIGQEQCFDEMCFTVTGADEIEGFLARGQERARLVRVKVRITNRGKGRAQSESLVRASLVDGQGRRWEEVRGLSGVRLTTMVAAGGSVVSEPVFRISKDAIQLGLVLTHGRWQPGVLVIGNPDSWMHRPTVMRLDR